MLHERLLGWEVVSIREMKFKSVLTSHELHKQKKRIGNSESLARRTDYISIILHMASTFHVKLYQQAI